MSIRRRKFSVFSYQFSAISISFELGAKKKSGWPAVLTEN